MKRTSEVENVFFFNMLKARKIPSFACVVKKTTLSISTQSSPTTRLTHDKTRFSKGAENLKVLKPLPRSSQMPKRSAYRPQKFVQKHFIGCTWIAVVPYINLSAVVFSVTKSLGLCFALLYFFFVFFRLFRSHRHVQGACGVMHCHCVRTPLAGVLCAWGFLAFSLYIIAMLWLFFFPSQLLDWLVCVL